WACCQEGEERLITGSERLLERPHHDLVDALRTLGADITAVAEGYRVKGCELRGGEVQFDSPISSQYLSALLLIAPAMEQGLSMRWTGTRLSEPYVHMTLKIMSHFGVYP
ncbi:MAG: 3-phosphoshikimate 1-carboxyvinyltransferase, partial [Flavobacteriales bacterium]